MPNLSRWAVLAVGLAVPATAVAQHREMGMAQHELGVDLTSFYAKGTGQTGTFNILTPVDVRLGFVSRGQLMVEPRFSLSLRSGGGTIYDFAPGLNLLWKLGTATHKKGPYLTGGAAVDIAKVVNSGAAFSLNGGIGTRVPYESGAWRLEAFGGYRFKSTDLGIPNTFFLGARVGLSVWH